MPTWSRCALNTTVSSFFAPPSRRATTLRESTGVIAVCAAMRIVPGSSKARSLPSRSCWNSSRAPCPPAPSRASALAALAIAYTRSCGQVSMPLPSGPRRRMPGLRQLLARRSHGDCSCSSSLCTSIMPTAPRRTSSAALVAREEWNARRSLSKRAGAPLNSTAIFPFTSTPAKSSCCSSGAYTPCPTNTAGASTLACAWLKLMPGRKSSRKRSACSRPSRTITSALPSAWRTPRSIGTRW